MIGYLTLGTNDIDQGAAFYDELLSVVGAKRLMDLGTFILWGTSMDKCALAITNPFDQQAATVGNGVMAGIVVNSQELVHEVHTKAIELGATDEGAPGPRGDGFYAGYFRDLDGNKLNVFVTG